MSDQGIAWKISGYLALPALIVLIAYILLNGLVLLLKPRRWIRYHGLHDSRFIDSQDMQRPGFLAQMRVTGLVVVLICVGVVLAALGIDTTELFAAVYAMVGLYWLFLCGPVLLIGGLYFLILPKWWDGPPWAPLGLALRNRIRNTLGLQIIVRAFGLACCWASWRFIAALLSLPSLP